MRKKWESNSMRKRRKGRRNSDMRKEIDKVEKEITIED